MSLIGDIKHSYLNPRSVMQRQIDRGITEPQTLFYGMLFGIINLVASYPRVADTATDPDTFTAMMAGLFISYVFFLPLMLYGLAAVIHFVILKIFSGKASWREARHALNWSAVVTLPLILINGLVYLFDNSILHTSINVIIALLFSYQIWSNFGQIEFQ